MAVALFGRVQAQTWTYQGCPDVTDADFSYTTLVQRGQAPDPGLSGPVKMDFDMDSKGNVDIYFVELRVGNIKRYNAATKTVTTLVKLPDWTGPEEGVTSIALDRDFKTNHFLYVHWSPQPASLEVYRISRFTVTGNTIDPVSEKIVLQIDGQRKACCHTGGGMAVDGGSPEH